MNVSSLDTQIPLQKMNKLYVINYCILYIKYYIYFRKLFNHNNLDVQCCQMQLKHAIEIEYEICNKNKTLVKFEKFNFYIQ